MRPFCAVLLACGVLSACGSSDAKTISKNDLAKEAQSKFDALAGGKIGKISCPEDLANKQGATTRCSVAGSKGKISVKVTSVDGNRAQLQFKGDDSLRPAR